MSLTITVSFVAHQTARAADMEQLKSDIQTWANNNVIGPAAYNLSSVQATTNQAGISGLVDLTSLSITVTAPSSRSILIEFLTNWVSGSSKGVEIYVVDELANTLQTCGSGLGDTPTPGTDVLTVVGSVVITPSAGSHTYKLRATPTNTAVTLSASSSRPAYIRASVL